MACSGAASRGREGRNDGGSMREFLKLLAKKGFDLNDWKNKDGQTPLDTFIEEGELDMVETLLEMKADVNYKDNAGKTPLWSAARFRRADMASLLLKHGAKTHPGIFALHVACLLGHADVVAVLLEAGADVLEVDASGFTPTRNCVLEPRDKVGEMDASLKKRKAEALSIILQGGGDLSELRKGFSLLHDAASNDLSGCVSVLVKRGLDPNTPSNDKFKRTPLHWACWCGRVLAVNTLCRLGANLDAVDGTNGFSPIFEAVMRGHDKCATTMIDLGASIVAKNKEGFTPLHAAAAAGQVKCAYLLLEAGAPVNELSNEGHGPLMVCMKPGLLVGLHLYGVEYGSKEERTRVARLFMEMDAHVCAKVMKYAVEEEMNEVLTDRMMQLTDLTKSLAGKSITIGNTLFEQSGEMVYVSLVDKNTGEMDEQRYKLNTQLVQHLAKGQGEEGEHASLTPTAGDAAPSSNVLSTLLDPGSRGFKEGEGIGTPGSTDVKEVKLTYDGSDFTKEGFGVVVAYMTTGRVDHLLVNKQSGVKRGGGGKGDGANDSDGNSAGDEGGGGSARRKRKRTTTEDGSPGASKRRCLFDGKLAGRALQAAGYFCLEGMTEEVKRLMDIYGFEIEEETTNAAAPVNS